MTTEPPVGTERNIKHETAWTCKGCGLTVVTGQKVVEVGEYLAHEVCEAKAKAAICGEDDG